MSMWYFNRKRDPGGKLFKKKTLLCAHGGMHQLGGGLLGDLLPSGKLDVCTSHDCYKYSHIASHQVSRFWSGLLSDWCKNRYIHGNPHRF